jgi:hypothetical protein
VFEWHSRDYFSIDETSRPAFLQTEPPEPVPYIHINAVAEDLDGNLIISLRRFDRIVKIDHQTGEILWQMGGVTSKVNDFTFINDPFNGFSGQHHVQILPNGN